MKKFSSVALVLVLSVLMLFSSVGSYLGATEEKAKENCIYFSVPTGEDSWGDFDTIYCHIWVDGSDEFFTWQTDHEKCEKVRKNLWKYNLDKLKSSRRVQGGFTEKTTYCVIFSDNIGNQTYDLYFKSECIGDTIECTNAYRGNPIDTKKKCVVARWQKNGDQYDSVEYTRETTVPKSTEDVSKEKEEDSRSLSQDMSMTIIFILSVVIVLLVIIMIVRSIKNKKSV